MAIKVNMLDPKIWKKNKVTIYDLCRFENVLVPEGNRKQNLDKSDRNKCQKHVACSYKYKYFVSRISLVSLLSHI